MRKPTLSFLLLCFAFMAWAEPVGKQTALYTAQSYMMAKGRCINAAKKPFKAARKNTASQTEEEAYYYVFNAEDNNGYVIVSGDDRIDPILGYVEQGSFDPDNIPDNMRDWLDGCAEEIKYVIDNDLQPQSPKLKRRSKVFNTKHSVPELMKSRWNQFLPYNLTLDLYYKEDGTQARPATGCIATAWAQVVNFHKYPNKIQVDIPSYSKTYTLADGSKKTVTHAAIPKGTPIDWENMRDTYSCNEEHAHTAQDTAVANLMRYCGHAVKMSYGASSSSSYRMEDFVKYFGFDDCATHISRDNYDIDGWIDVIYNELAEGYPIPVAGTKITGAHAFVIDGFDGENLFHVNWGWGSGGGWYILGILNRWNRGNGGIINLRRPDGVKAEKYLSVNKVTISGTYIKTTFKNSTGDSNTSQVGIVKLDEDGGTSLVGAVQNITAMADGATQDKSFPISKKLPEGTYRLSPATKPKTSDTWKVHYNLRDQYIEAVVDSTGKPTMRIVNPVYDISIDTITFPRMRIVGEEQQIDVTFRNDGDEFYHDIFLFASKTNEKVYADYMFRVYAHKGETVTFPYYYTPTETGTYNLWFCTEKNGNGEIGRGTMEIRTEAEAEADRANLSITHTIINGTNNSTNNGGIAYGNRLYGKAAVKNNGKKDFHGSIELQLWHQNKNSNSAVSGPSQSFDLDIPAKKTVTFEYEFDNLSSAYYYRIKALYGNQSGNLTGGGMWDVKIDMQDGILTWKNDGTVVGKAYASTASVLSSLCGFYADCSKKISRITPNKSNPNVIYALGADMDIPASIDTCNAVSGNHAKHINMVNDQPYYISASFTADNTSFTYTFPETENGTGWHTFTLPFAPDSVFVDGVPVSLEDGLKHFWIYEFAAQTYNGELIFAPATVLRGGTPYIIAADSTMAGRSIVFQALDVFFSKTGSEKMLVTSPDYTFHGITIAPKIKECYILNTDGTAFEYVATSTTLTGLGTYFTTSLAEEQRLPSIVLPNLSMLKAELADLENSITPVLPSEKRNGAIYDLQGRKINSQLKRGIYIVNGKKVAVK